MNKKVMKVMSVLMVVVMLAIAVSPVIFATSLADKAGLSNNKSSTFDNGITNIGSNILSILTTIGIVISVLVIAGLGIKYITGSAEEKAEYKKSFIPLLVGMVLLLSASVIAKFLIGIAQQ